LDQQRFQPLQLYRFDPFFRCQNPDRSFAARTMTFLPGALTVSVRFLHTHLLPSEVMAVGKAEHHSVARTLSPVKDTAIRKAAMFRRLDRRYQQDELRIQSILCRNSQIRRCRFVKCNFYKMSTFSGTSGTRLFGVHLLLGVRLPGTDQSMFTSDHICLGAFRDRAKRSRPKPGVSTNTDGVAISS
jgi:hypothetical protein